MDSWRRREGCLLVGLFLLAFLPRALYPVSRPLQWYFRSAQFIQAVLHRDWAGTLFSEHPGVTVMWLSGAVLWGWQGIESLAGRAAPSPLETEGLTFFDRVSVGVLPLALVIALGIVWGWHLLHRLFGRRVAWVAALLWALDPFYLANSKVLHLDAALSTLMMLSVLLMLIYLREHRLRQVALSALLGGLAVLTKVSALFLVPFWGLCLLVDHVSSLQGPFCGLRSLVAGLQLRFRNLGLWILVSVMTCLVLWPSLWVQAAASIDLVFRQGILLHAGGPRDQPLFYRGAFGVLDPGPRYYLDVILFRTTFLTLPFSVVGLLRLRPWRREASRCSQVHRTSVLLLASFAAFYLLQMSLGGWKDGRYILPVLLVVDVLAAHGIELCVAGVPVAAPGRTAVIAGLMAAQACLVLFHHPYYGTHYNELLGGPAAASRVFPLGEFGEGLDLAGQFIHGRLGGKEAAVSTQFLANEMVAQHVRVPVKDIARTGDDADYLVFGVQYTMRGSDYPRWGKLWDDTYKFREPAFVASFSGLPYAWVHRPNVIPSIPEPLGAQVGARIQLVGYRLAEYEVAPGDTLLLTLYWQAAAPVGEAYTVFTHLQGPEGELIAQQDNPPGRGSRPTDSWVPGALIEDPYEIEVPRDTVPGEYTVSAGMYDPIALERLPASGADGERLSSDRIVLATVLVRPAVPAWRWMLSAVWLGVVAAGSVRGLQRSSTRGDRALHRGTP